MAAERTTIQDLIARKAAREAQAAAQPSQPAQSTQLLPAVMSSQSVQLLKRELVARLFAASFVECKFDHVRAYMRVVERYGPTRLRRGGRAGTPEQRERMAKRWLSMSLPFVQELMEQAARRAGITLEGIYAYLQAAITVSPADFVKQRQVLDKDGKPIPGMFETYFDIEDPAVQDKRQFIESLTIKNGVIANIKVINSMQAIAQVQKFKELEAAGKTGAKEGVTDSITKRFQAAKASRIDSSQKPVLVASNVRR